MSGRTDGTPADRDGDASSAARERMRGRVAIGCWLVFVAACAAVVLHTRFTADMSAFLPREASAEQQILVDQLREGALSRLLLIGIEGADAAARARIVKTMGAALRDDAAFAAVHDGDARETARDREYLFANRYLLSPAVTAGRFSVAGLRAAIADSIDLLASPAGMLLKNVLPRDPTGELVRLTSDLAGDARPQTIDGAWTSRDGSRALLLAETKAAGSDLDAQAQAIDRVRAAFGRASAQSGSPPGEATLLLSGTGVFAVASRATIQREVLRLSLLSTTLVVLLLLAVYRSVTALVLGLVPVVSGALAAVATVSLVDGFVHGLTLGFGTTLIGEAIDYSIYLFIQSGDRVEASGGKGTNERRRAPGLVKAGQHWPGGHAHAAGMTWVTRFWPTIRLGVLTSICGFATLLASGFPGLAQLGLYSIAGLVVAAVVTRFVLPHLLPRGFRVRDLTALGRQLEQAIGVAARAKWLLVMIAMAAVAVLVLDRDTLWNRELAALSPVSPADQALDQKLRSDLGAPDARYLVVASGASVEAALEASERAASALQPLVLRGVLVGFESPSRFLPSDAAQRARIAALPPRAELEARLREATGGLPLRAERLGLFLDDVEAARNRAPLTRADLAGTSLAHAVDALLVRQGERFTAMLPLRAACAPDSPGAPRPPGVPSHGTQIDPSAVRAALASAGADALFVDIKDEADRLYASYLREAIRLSLAGFIAIVVLLAVALRKPARVLRVLAPLAVAVLAVAASLALAGRQLILLHLVGMLLIVAIGSNYALFFNRGTALPDDPHDGARPRMLASLLAANLTTVAGFGLLAFSSVPVLSALGMTVGPGAILALAFAAMLSARR